MKLLLVDIEVAGYDSNGDATINIGSLAGNEYPVVLHDDNWWYGEQLGMCGTGNNAPEDAASQLQKRVIDELLPTTSSNCKWYFTNLENTYFTPTDYQLDSNPDNYLDYKIFYATDAVGPLDYDVKCLSQYEMTFYEGHYIYLAEDYEDQYLKDFAKCEISGNPYNDAGITRIQHDYRIFIGNRILECDFTIDDILAIE